MSHNIRVIIADDHPIIREGIRTTLATHPQIQVIGEAQSFNDILRMLETTAAHVLVLDLIGMGAGPITMVDRLRRDYPKLAIVVFSSVLDLAPELLAAGVLGYVLKDELAEQLVRAILAAQRGGCVLSEAVATYLARTEALKQRINLSTREHQVLRLLTKGYRTDELANQLGIDPRTVQNHISAMLHKTTSTQRAQLIAWYRREIITDSR